MKGHLRARDYGRWTVEFGRPDTLNHLYKSFSPVEYGTTAKALVAARKWHKENQDWTEGRKTANSIKVNNYLKELKKGSKINVGTLAKELGVDYAVVDNQIKRNFKGKFKLLEAKDLWFDPKTRLPYTKDGIKFEPKFFRYYGKDGKVQNRRLWQTQETTQAGKIGEWKVLTEGKKEGKI